MLYFKIGTTYRYLPKLICSFFDDGFYEKSGFEALYQILEKKLIKIIALSLVLLPVAAFSASFDCRKSSTEVEKKICAHSELSKLDDRLSAIYDYAMSHTIHADGKSILRKEQREWLSMDRDRCADVGCITNSYHRRINELESSLLDMSATSTNDRKNEITSSPSEPGVASDVKRVSSSIEAVYAPYIDAVRSDILRVISPALSRKFECRVEDGLDSCIKKYNDNLSEIESLFDDELKRMRPYGVASAQLQNNYEGRSYVSGLSSTYRFLDPSRLDLIFGETLSPNGNAVLKYTDERCKGLLERNLRGEIFPFMEGKYGDHLARSLLLAGEEGRVYYIQSCYEIYREIKKAIPALRLETAAILTEDFERVVAQRKAEVLAQARAAQKREDEKNEAKRIQEASKKKERDDWIRSIRKSSSNITPGEPGNSVEFWVDKVFSKTDFSAPNGYQEVDNWIVNRAFYAEETAGVGLIAFQALHALSFKNIPRKDRNKLVDQAKAIMAIGISATVKSIAECDAPDVIVDDDLKRKEYKIAISSEINGSVDKMEVYSVVNALIRNCLKYRHEWSGILNKNVFYEK